VSVIGHKDRAGPLRDLLRGADGNSDWCCADVRAGAVTAAIGSTLLRSHGMICREKLLRQPAHFDAQYLLGVALLQAGEEAQGEECIEAA
jgi:hypothetical protein